MSARGGGTAERVPRLLALLPYLLAHPGAPLAEVARTFGVPVEQVRRDLELLWVCGLPGHGPGDLIDLTFSGDTVTVTHDAGVRRPLRLTPDEATALLVALRTLADVPGLEERAALDRALAKVEQAAGAAAEPAAGVVVSVEAQEETVAAVQRALDASRRLHLAYHVQGRDEVTERDVDPMRLVLAEGRTYLEAWCRRAQGVRLFRLDRVVRVEVLDTDGTPPPEAQPRDLAAGLFTPSAHDVVVVLELQAAARWVADHYPCDSVEEHGDGTLTVALRTPDPAWVRRLALTLGASGRVAEPPSLAAAVRADATAALAAYPD